MTKQDSNHRPDGPLTASDDLPLHQTAETLYRVASDNPRFTERWYFNLQRPDGSMIGICGGGFYPHTGTLEVYACLLIAGRQVNLRQRVTEFDRMRLDSADSVTFAISEPMRTWTMKAHGSEFEFDLTFAAAQQSYLFPPFFVAADFPHQATSLQVDTIQHFVQPGVVTGSMTIGGESTAVEARSFRDRTWGVRTARPRLHQWYVLHLDDGSSVNLIHQERADGTVMVSHLARVGAEGEIETGVIDQHELTFDPVSRQLRQGVYQAHTARGTVIQLRVDNLGEGVRLLGAGYTGDQGEASGLGRAQEDSWDLSDPDVVARVGKGTIDSPVRGTCTWGDSVADGIGITETAIARNHWRYGVQLSGH